MARKKKDNIEQNDIQVKEVVKEQDNKENNKKQEKNNKQNKDIIVQDNVPRALSRDTRTLEQKLQSYKRKLRKI